jgi:hypothetical protein
MNHWEYIPNEGETVVAKGHPQLNDPFLRRYHLRKAFLTAAQVYFGLWGARLLAENM